MEKERERETEEKLHLQYNKDLTNSPWALLIIQMPTSHLVPTSPVPSSEQQLMDRAQACAAQSG